LNRTNDLHQKFATTGGKDGLGEQLLQRRLGLSKMSPDSDTVGMLQVVLPLDYLGLKDF
jgi:hypothetical protein